MLCRVLCVLLFLAWTAESPDDKLTYCGLWRSPLVVFAPLFGAQPAIGLSIWQVLLFVLAPVCLIWPGSFRKRDWRMDAAILTSAGSVALTLLWGLLRGGSAYNAYFQLWKFLLALLIAALLVSVIRTSRDLKALGLTVLMAALVRGSLAVYFYWAHVRGKLVPPPPYMTTHDDSLLFAAGLLVPLSWALEQRKWRVWLATAVVSVLLLYAITLNNRRLAWLELLLGLAFMYVLFRRGTRRRINRGLLLAAPALLAYGLVGWGRTEPVFAPIKAFSTAGSDEDASSLARLEEIRNLLYTLSAAGNPLLGTGWGRPYLKVSSVYANFGSEWLLYLYLPHNSLLGLVVFGGLVGICGIWLVVPLSAFLAMRAYRRTTRPVDRAAAMAALAILPGYSAHCYGDIGFQSFTCSLILGVAMAVAGKLSGWADARGVKKRALHEGP